MGAGPYFDSGGFRRDQANSVGVHLVDVNGNPYTAGGGAGSSIVDAQSQFKEGAAFVYMPGTAARGLLVDPINGTTDGAVGLPARVGVVAGWDGTNSRAIKTSAAGVLQADILSMPSGGSTLAEQQTQTTRLTSIRDRLPAATRTSAASTTDEGMVVHVATQPAGGAAGTQYTEGDIDATITGNALMWEDASDTLRSVSVAKPLPVAQQGTVTITGALTDTQLRASAVPVSGPLTDTQLRASAVPVDSELTTADLDTGAGTDTRAVMGLVRAESGGGLLVGSANPLPVTGPLTDAQIRATALPVSGPLTDTQLRATAVPVSLAANQSVNVAQMAGTATDTNSGVKSAGTQRIVIATDQPQLTNALKVDGSAVTQPVSGTVTASGPLTDTQLRASAVPVSGPLTDTQLRASAFAVTTTGNVASDAVDSGSPVKVGGLARTADITAVAQGDRVDSLSTILGKSVVQPYALPGQAINGMLATALTGTTAADVIAAPGAGIRLYITEITVTNNHATVNTKVEIRDGTTVKKVISAAALGGGASITLPTPLRLTAATALTCRPVTTGADIDCSATGYTAAE